MYQLNPGVPLPGTETEVDIEVIEALGDESMFEADLLVEDVSIDGMCGVY